MDTINGSAAMGWHLVGTLTPIGGLTGMLNVPTYLEADWYTGDYEVTPSLYEQTLLTKDKTLSNDVTINAIPGYYADTTGDDGTAEYVLDRLKVHSYDSNTGNAVAITGSMPNHRAWSWQLDTTINTDITVPKGYHNGNGHVNVVPEEKTCIPSETAIEVTPSKGKVLSKVTVAPIPQNYGRITWDGNTLTIS